MVCLNKLSFLKQNISEKKNPSQVIVSSNLTIRRFGSEFTCITHFVDANNENVVSKYLLLSMHSNTMVNKNLIYLNDIDCSTDIFVRVTISFIHSFTYNCS